MSRSRRRRDQRADQPSPMRLTERDLQILDAVHQCRILRQDQLETLFFGSRSATQRVLARLFQHGYLARQFLPVLTGRSPTLYVLDRRGAEALRAYRGEDNPRWQRGDRPLKTDFIAHTMAINDMRVAVTRACTTLGYGLVEWRSESALKTGYARVVARMASGRLRRLPVVPDSYFVLDTPLGRAHFFLEVDRGTEKRTQFQAKIEAYLEYYASGAYETRYGTKSLRIVTVVPSPQRLLQLQDVTEAVSGKRRFWFALATDIAPTTVLAAPIWHIAGETQPEPLIDLRNGGRL